MVVPTAGRVIAAVAGALLVITATRSLVGTVIVPRPVGSWLTRWVDRIVNAIYVTITNVVAQCRRLARTTPGERNRLEAGIVKVSARWADRASIDQIFAGQASAILLGQLIAWVVIFYIGFALLMWPFIPKGIATAFSLAGPGVFGPNDSLGAAERTIADLAAIAALITVTLQIAYLPTLYSAFIVRHQPD